MEWVFIKKKIKRIFKSNLGKIKIG